MSNLPKMSYTDKIERRDQKQALILQFLSDFEVFTCVVIVSQLLAISPSSARRTLDQLVKSGLLIAETHYIDGHAVKVYGISSAGLLAVDAEIEAPYFERLKVKSNFIHHKLETQRIRIITEGMGAKWTSERKLRATKGLKKFPDAVCEIYLNNNRVPGNRLFIECEREPKTAKRYAQILKNYLHSIEIKELGDAVVYLFPHKYLSGATRLLKSIELPECPTWDNHQFYRPYRFLIGALENPLELKFLHSGESVGFSKVTDIPDELD
jgi:DNA-binding PadR family transcriptional regulator